MLAVGAYKHVAPYWCLQPLATRIARRKFTFLEKENHLLRIDHLLLSPEAADRITGAGVDKGPRGEEKPSDHTPVWVELADPA